MLLHSAYRQLVVQMRPPRGARAARRSRLRESRATIVLGALSTAIGVALMIGLFQGMAGRSFGGWNERAVTSTALYYVPIKDCAIWAFVAVGLGLAGLALGRMRDGAFSMLSIVGTVVSVVYIWLFFAHVSLKELF